MLYFSKRLWSSIINKSSCVSSSNVIYGTALSYKNMFLKEFKFTEFFATVIARVLSAQSSNANCPLSNSMICIVKKKFEHVQGANALYRGRARGRGRGPVEGSPVNRMTD